MASLLKNSSGVGVQGSQVIVNGVDKMSVKELAELYNKNIHNMDADQATPGRFIESEPTSYEQVPRANATAHFNLEGDGWGNARTHEEDQAPRCPRNWSTSSFTGMSTTQGPLSLTTKGTD